MKMIEEATVYTGIILFLCGMIYSEGQKNIEIQSRLPISAQQLYKKLSQSQIKLQILDIRPKLESYDDTHIPGSIPLPNCQFENLPEGVATNIYAYLPTIIVSEDGNPEILKQCRSHFKNIQNLNGGIKAWLDDNLPEDSGEYLPPKLKAGGGCL